jgi:hypothetical protein
MVTRVLFTFESLIPRGAGGEARPRQGRRVGARGKRGGTSEWVISAMRELALLTAKSLHGETAVEREAGVIWDAGLWTLSVRIDTPAGQAVARVFHRLAAEQYAGCEPLPWRETIWVVIPTSDRPVSANDGTGLPGQCVPEGPALLQRGGTEMAGGEYWKEGASDSHGPASGKMTRKAAGSNPKGEVTGE